VSQSNWRSELQSGYAPILELNPQKTLSHTCGNWEPTSNMAKVKKQSPAAVSLKRIKDEMEDDDYAKDSSEERPIKRGKSSTSATSISRSATPTIPAGHVAFNVQYPDAIKLEEKGKEVLKHAEFMVSPFKAKRANKKGELDTYFVVQPSSEWESMRKYTNFVSMLGPNCQPKMDSMR
jgi:hypothetical protein